MISFDPDNTDVAHCKLWLNQYSTVNINVSMADLACYTREGLNKLIINALRSRQYTVLPIILSILLSSGTIAIWCLIPQYLLGESLFFFCISVLMTTIGFMITWIQCIFDNATLRYTSSGRRVNRNELLMLIFCSAFFIINLIYFFLSAKAMYPVKKIEGYQTRGKAVGNLVFVEGYYSPYNIAGCSCLNLELNFYVAGFDNISTNCERFEGFVDMKTIRESELSCIANCGKVEIPCDFLTLKYNVTSKYLDSKYVFVLDISDSRSIALIFMGIIPLIIFSCFKKR